MLEIIIVTACILLNGVLACAEIAFVSVRPYMFQKAAREGDKKAQLILKLRKNPARMLSTIQIGISFVGAFAAAISGTFAEEIFTPFLSRQFNLGPTGSSILSIFIIIIPFTYISVVLGELVPKVLALKNRLYFAKLTVRPLYIASSILTPLVRIFEVSTKGLVHLVQKLFQIKSEPEPSDEVLELESLQLPSRQYVFNIINLEKKTVRESLVPWGNVCTLLDTFTRKEVEKVIIETGHTRIPVLQGENIRGVLYTKEFFARSKVSWTDLIRPVMRLSPDTDLLPALLLLQKKQEHMALVIDEGVPLGILTLEDILEEIVGEIYDEHDTEDILALHNP